MELHGLSDVLQGRPRVRDALGGFVAESAAFFSSSVFRRGFRELVASATKGGAWSQAALATTTKGDEETSAKVTVLSRSRTA